MELIKESDAIQSQPLQFPSTFLIIDDLMIRKSKTTKRKTKSCTHCKQKGMTLMNGKWHCLGCIFSFGSHTSNTCFECSPNLPKKLSNIYLFSASSEHGTVLFACFVFFLRTIFVSFVNKNSFL
jgi:hypothetical protein